MKGLLYSLADWRLHNKTRACQFPDKPSRILHLITYAQKPVSQHELSYIRYKLMRYVMYYLKYLL